MLRLLFQSLLRVLFFLHYSIKQLFSIALAHLLLLLLLLLLFLLVNNMILKPLVDRTRPYEVVQGLTLLIEKQKDASFPSGHTASSFAAAVVMFHMLPKRYGIPALLLAFLIGLSRLYVGVHYPTDVLCGLLSGTVLALLSVWIVKRLTAWYCKREGKK